MEAPPTPQGVPASVGALPVASVTVSPSPATPALRGAPSSSSVALLVVRNTASRRSQRPLQPPSGSLVSIDQSPSAQLLYLRMSFTRWRSDHRRDVPAELR